MPPKKGKKGKKAAYNEDEDAVEEEMDRSKLQEDSSYDQLESSDKTKSKKKGKKGLGDGKKKKKSKASTQDYELKNIDVEGAGEKDSSNIKLVEPGVADTNFEDVLTTKDSDMVMVTPEDVLESKTEMADSSHDGVSQVAAISSEDAISYAAEDLGERDKVADQDIPILEAAVENNYDEDDELMLFAADKEQERAQLQKDSRNDQLESSDKTSRKKGKKALRDGKKKKKSKASTEDYELKINDVKGGESEKDSSNVKLVEPGVADTNFEDVLTTKNSDMVMVTPEDVPESKMEMGERSHDGKSQVAAISSEDAIRDAAENFGNQEDIVIEREETASPEAQSKQDNAEKPSEVDEKPLDASPKTSVSENVVMKASVETEYRQTVQIETRYESESLGQKEQNLSDELQAQEDTLKDSLKEGIPLTTARRNLAPGAPEEKVTEDEAGSFNGPQTSTSPIQDNNPPVAEKEDKEVPHRRAFTPNGADQTTDDDGGNFSAPLKTKERLDTNGNSLLDHNVLAGRMADDDDDDDDEMPWAMYRNMKKEEPVFEEEVKFSSDDEAVGNDFKKGENLPELYEFLGSLDNGDTELESRGVPPSLFKNEQHRHMHQSIDKMKLALAEDEIGAYLEEFEKHVEEEVLMIGNIGLEEVQEEERNIRESHLEYQKDEARIQKDKRQELLIAMENAKKHVMLIFREKHGKLRDKELALMKRDNRLQGEISKAFRRSENQLIKALRKRKAEVEAMYGDLVFADGQYGGGHGKRWKVDWNKTSQPIQIKIKCLRSVRDKLPLGQYVLMVSLYSRVGGHVMKWSNLKGQKWGAATLPLIHDGEFFNTEMKIDQSVFTVCPSKPDMRPGMVLMFELFILSGHVTPTDKIVGWGCFPICDGGFNVVDGKYKTPLLRGSIDSSVDKFQEIEERISHDLEFWLCNLYFEIVKLPRYLTGQKEYEVELQFSSGLVSYPVRTKTGEEFVDGEHPVYGSNPDMSSIAASRASLNPSRAPSFLDLGDENSDHKVGQSNIKLRVEPPKRKISRPSSAVSASMKLQKASEISTELRHRRTSHTSVSLQPSETVATRKLSVVSRNSIDERSLGYSDDSDTGSGTDYNEDDVCIVKKDNGFRHVKGQPGMYYKVHQNNPADVYARKLYSSLPKTAVPSPRRKKKKLTHLDELKQHSYNVKSLWSNKGHMPRKGREKMQYIGRMMLAELGLSQWRNSQFWITLFMLLVTWFIRMYLHYFGQWVLLKALSIPINKFNFYAHTVNLNYQDTLLQARHELGIVIMGPFTNFFFFTMFIPLTYCFQRFFKWFPDIITQFMLTFGIQAFLDPLWIVVVDSAIGRYKNIGGSEPIGDAFKLYWHFYRNYRNDDVTFYVSISLTTFLYVVVAFCTAALWYMFFIRLHNNGRLMDVYWRLHGSEEEFFLPYDLEVSNEELNYICTKAEQWRGDEGERRKVAVYDYVWEQEELAEENWDDPNAHGEKTGTREITTHLSIHTISLDGLIELHRHFLRLPDGAIIEVFGEMNMPGIDEGVKQALMKKTGFQGTSNIVRRSRSLSVSSMGSSNGNGKASLRRMSSNRLDVPV